MSQIGAMTDDDELERTRAFLTFAIASIDLQWGLRDIVKVELELGLRMLLES
jgi:hypothetical protein